MAAPPIAKSSALLIQKIRLSPVAFMARLRGVGGLRPARGLPARGSHVGSARVTRVQALQYLRFEPDWRRERGGHETGLLALLHEAQCSVRVRARRHGKSRAKDNLGEPYCATRPVHRSLAGELERSELEPPSLSYPTQGDEKARLDGREQQVLGAPGISRFVEVYRRRRRTAVARSAVDSGVRSLEGSLTASFTASGARGADARGTPRSRLTLDLSNDMVPRHCADRRSVRY